MGYYLETPVSKGKADWLLANVLGTVEVTVPVPPRDTHVLCFAVENAAFDAVAVAYNQNETDRFIRGRSGRPVRYLHVPLKEVLRQLPMLVGLLEWVVKTPPSRENGIRDRR